MRRYAAALTGMCLAAGIAFAWVEADGQSPRVAASSVPPPVRGIPVLLPPDTAGLTDQIRQRPLFAPTRRPAVVASAPPVAMAPMRPPEPAGTLLGTAISPGVRVALFRRAGSGATVSVTIGEALDRWVVTAIDLGSVTLHADTGEERTVSVERSLGVAPPIKLQLGVFHHNVS